MDISMENCKIGHEPIQEFLKQEPEPVFSSYVGNARESWQLFEASSDYARDLILENARLRKLKKRVYLTMQLLLPQGPAITIAFWLKEMFLPHCHPQAKVL